MPRDGSGIYAAPGGTNAITDTTISSAAYNVFVADLISDANTARPVVAGGTGLTSLASLKAALSLDLVTNTADASKPVSTAQQAALDLKAPLASPAFTGTPAAPAPAQGTATTQIATTAFVLAAIASIPGYLSGLRLSQASSTTFGIAKGAAANDDGGTAYGLVLTSAFTKSLSSWAVGTANGGLDTGSVANTTWYHAHLIRKDADASIDVLYSLSPTSPTMPSGYTASRRIGSFLTDGSAHVVNFTQNGDEFLWNAVVIDGAATSPGTSAVTKTLTVPTGVIVTALINPGLFNPDSATAQVSLNISSLAVSDEAPQAAGTSSLTLPATISALSNVNAWTFGSAQVRTNTSGQIRTRFSATGTSLQIGIITRGWIDTRGK